MKKIVVDVAKCTGCEQCVLTCSFRQAGSFGARQSHIHVVQWEAICLSVPLTCQQCPDVPCVAACPTNALAPDPMTGAIRLDPGTCSQCGACVAACRYQVMQTTADGFPRVCDLCNGDPACVRVCYPGALRYADMAQPDWEPWRPWAGILTARSAGELVPPPAELLVVAEV